MIDMRAGGGWVLALAAMAPLGGCDHPAASAPSTSTAAADAASSAKAPPPLAGVTPAPADVTASGPGGTGPGDAATAVGGLAAQQDAGGARKGSVPAPTGGDAAASAASR